MKGLIYKIIIGVTAVIMLGAAILILKPSSPSEVAGNNSTSTAEKVSTTSVIKEEEIQTTSDQDVGLFNSQESTSNDSFDFLDSPFKDYTLITEFHDKILSFLKERNVDEIISMIDPDVINNLGETKLQFILENGAIPFFEDYQKLGVQQDWFPAPISDDLPGYSLYQSLTDKNGDMRPFVLLMSKRDDKLYLTDIILDKTYEDLHNGKHPGE